MSVKSADAAIEWLKFSAYVVGGIATVYAVWKIYDALAASGGLGSIFKGAGDVAKAAGTAVSDASDITTATTEQAAAFLGFDFSTTDPSTFPGYAVGNWNKMMGSAANPLSPSYKQSTPTSIVNPGPTQVKNWSDTLYNEMGQSAKYLIPGVNPDFNKILAIYEQMPDLDNVNLVYLQCKNDHGFDLAADINGMMISFSDIFKDIIASIILKKSP
jgi:hypothetical protein